MDSLPQHVYIFSRKAMQNQLPTLHNRMTWKLSTSGACPRCGVAETNKHVLSNCGHRDALSRYTDRHNRILELLAKWIVTRLKSNYTLYCDLNVPGALPVCDLFNGFRPDLAIVSLTQIVVGELSICHETNLVKSRDYKLQKYRNLEAAKESEFKKHAVQVYTIE